MYMHFIVNIPIYVKNSKNYYELKTTYFYMYIILFHSSSTSNKSDSGCHRYAKTKYLMGVSIREYTGIKISYMTSPRKH